MTSWPSVLKALAFGISLFLTSGDTGIFWSAVFLIFSFVFYFIQPVESKKFVYSFLILVFYSLVFAKNILNPNVAFGLAIISGLAFFILLGVKDFVFIKRERFFNFLSGYLYFLVSAAFFLADKTQFAMLFFYFLTFFAYWAISKEFMELVFPELPKTKRALVVIGSAFLITELATIISLLPIGFLNSSALVILFIFILEDLIFYHLKGKLNRQIIINNITILIVAVILIFAVSKWAL